VKVSRTTRLVAAISTLLSSAALISVIPHTPAMAATGVVVPDGGFENGAYAAPWTLSGGAVVGDGNVHSGIYALELHPTASSATQTISLKPNTPYALTGWIKLANAGDSAQLTAQVSGGQVQSAPVSTTGYSQTAVHFTTPSDSGTVKISCAKGASSGEAWCDDLNLQDQTGDASQSFTQNNSSVIKNPGMGWQMYVLATAGDLPDATQFWNEMDGKTAWYQNDGRSATAVATGLYIRTLWSTMEPAEGHYIWKAATDPWFTTTATAAQKYDAQNYLALVQGAQQRGLKLNFRVIEDSYNSSPHTDKTTGKIIPGTTTYQQATPQFVFNDKASGYHSLTTSPDLTPYLDDAVYQQKFTDFVTAFGFEYNDAARVDFIDGFGLGYWGEGNISSDSHLRNSVTAQNNVMSWLTTLYHNKFSKVLLALNYSPDPTSGTIYAFTQQSKDNAINNLGYSPRQDSVIGDSTYDFATFTKFFSARPFFAEGGAANYEKCAAADWPAGTATDPCKSPSDITSELTDIEKTAEDVHANTLDLRLWQDDTYQWVNENPLLVQDFAVNGGYRLSPSRIDYPPQITANTPFAVGQTWVNAAKGVLPNKLPAWGSKYRVSYALLDPTTNAVKAQYIDTTIDPGDWVKGTDYYNISNPSFNVTAADYKLAVSIVDTSTSRNLPAIKLGTTNNRNHVVTGTGWHILGSVNVK
jgi:hypothetical protein